ncbi:hypothetical protein BY458DRAFT_433557 [Sporodiniella umbellata]|nr:hypothetical protein BY458DRAFT_433557 [Sporodiniella umbellata]
MTRSKDSFIYDRYEKQTLRSNQSEATRIKKMGAGSFPWDSLDAGNDVEELVYNEIDSHTINNTSTKLCLVDTQTFKTLRHEQLS